MTTAAQTMPVRNRAEDTTQENQLVVIGRRFLRHRLATASLIMILIVFVASLLAPVITVFPRDAIDLSSTNRPAPPGVVDSQGRVHILGIDQLGRDLYTRNLYAARVSLSIAFTVVLFSETIGTLLGAVAGYYGGAIDMVISRITEFMLTIPTLPILLIISAILIKSDTVLPLPTFVTKTLSSIMLAPEREVQKVVVLIVILIVFGWMGSCRLMRGMALSETKKDYVESLHSVGASDPRIIFRHIIPNGLAPILVNASLNLGGIIVLEAALSFLGLGVQDPTPTWGNILALSQSYMATHPWMPLVPGVPLVIVSIGFNFIGDGLRDALDPRLKR
jgi:peptide/nickel transport system permease protein